MELDDSNVLFTSRLLSLDQASRVVDANNETTSDLWVKSARMAGLVDLEDFLDPGDDLVGGRIGGLVQVDDAILLEDVDGTVSWRVTTGKRCEVGRLDVKFVEVLYT